MKKSYLYILMVVSFISSCNGGGETETENVAPSIPTQVYPSNNLLCIDSDVEFQWEASVDPENNSIRYKIEVAESSLFETIVYEKTTNSLRDLKSLEPGKIFYWRVMSIDAKGAESDFSPANKFVVEGDGNPNFLPFIPELISPTENSLVEGSSVTLSWSANDINKDALSFDVYLDTVNPPQVKVSANQTETSYKATGLNAATTYYFKVDVKDDNSGQTLGQVWSFQTK